MVLALGGDADRERAAVEDCRDDREHRAELVEVECLSQPQFMAQGVPCRTYHSFCQPVPPRTPLGREPPLGPLGAYLRPDLSPVWCLGRLDQGRGVVRVQDPGLSVQAREESMRCQEYIRAIARAREQTHGLGRHTNVGDHPALESSSTLCSVLDPERAKQVQGRRLEGGADLEALLGQAAHLLLLQPLVSIPAVEAVGDDSFGQTRGPHYPDRSP